MFARLPVLLGYSALTVIVSVTSALAEQDSVVNATGFQANHEYSSTSPSEYIDMATGSLILTFNPLSLPGPNGRNLTFQVTYNSKNGGATRWGFGLVGYPLSVYDPGLAPPGTPRAAIEQAYAPRIFGWDGSVHRTYIEGDPTYVWVTSEFWRYAVGDLWMPDGTHCRYESNPAVANTKRLKTCWSPQNVEELAIDWEASTITQKIDGSSRVVGFTSSSITEPWAFTLTFWGEPGASIPLRTSRTASDSSLPSDRAGS